MEEKNSEEIKNQAEEEQPEQESKIKALALQLLEKIKSFLHSTTKRERIIAAVCAAAALLAAAGISYRIAENYVWDNFSVTISQKYYDGTVKKTRTLVNEPVELEEPPAIEGRIFLGWENGQGERLSPQVITATVTESYTAKYIVDLDRESRTAYIFPDENGLYRLEETLTRSEAAIMLDTVLADRVAATETFTDVPKSAECYEAACRLKTLCVCTGGRFYPEEYMTLGELLQMLSSFYPVCEGNGEEVKLERGNEYYNAFALAAEKGWISSEKESDPYSPITKGEAVLIINAALGRSADCVIPQSCATGILEYRPGDEMFAPLAQAAVEHSYELDGGKERWLTSSCKAEYEEGFYFIGTDMYYVESDGHFAKGTEVNGFSFDSQGIYTSGDEELDALVKEVIDEYYSPDLTREELLRELFDFTVKSFKYKRRTFYTSGDRTYAAEAAKIMLSERTGNCYNYAATFCMLSRALGYDAYVCSGVVGRNMDRHGWCEILIDDVPYICDAELMMKKPGLDMYMKTYRELTGWNYREGQTYHKG